MLEIQTHSPKYADENRVVDAVTVLDRSVLEIHNYSPGYADAKQIVLESQRECPSVEANPLGAQGVAKGYPGVVTIPWERQGSQGGVRTVPEAVK